VKLPMLTALPKRRTGDSEERIVIITPRGGSLPPQTLVTGSNLSTLLVKLPTNKFRPTEMAVRALFDGASCGAALEDVTAA
jgi:hypothetical protein